MIRHLMTCGVTCCWALVVFFFAAQMNPSKGLPLSARRVNRSSLELPHSPVGRIVQSTPKVSPRRAPLATERSAPRFPREPGHLRICEAAPQLDTQSMMFSSTLESGLRLRNGAFPASASVDHPRASLLQICEQGSLCDLH